MRRIKDYFLYAPFLYSVLTIGVVPVCIIIGTVLAQLVNGNQYLFIATMIVIIQEVFSDFWLWGGFLSKEAQGIELIKTSKEGIHFYQNVISTSIVIKMVTICVVHFGAGVLPVLLSNHSFAELSKVILYCCFVSLSSFVIVGIMQIVSRFFENFIVGLLFGYFAQLTAIPIYILLDHAIVWCLCIVALVLAIGCGYGEYVIMNRKMKGYYYDNVS